MPYILAFFASLLDYLGGGWCIFNIYLSIFPIEASDTLHDIACNQLLVNAIIATVVNSVCLHNADIRGANLPDTMCSIGVLAPLTLWAFAKWALPLSLGFGILNTVICIFLMTYFAGKLFDRLF